VILPKRVLEIPLKKLFEETWWSAVVVVDTEVLVVVVDTEVLVGVVVVEKKNHLLGRCPISVDETDSFGDSLKLWCQTVNGLKEK
jgi:hypothetical protein